MYGHEPLIAMRKRGIVPKMVFLNDFHCQTAKDWHNPGEKYGEVWPADHVTISTATEAISSLDLRFLIGLNVCIASESEKRCKALYSKAKWFGAKTVAACVVHPDNHARSAGWSEVFHAEVAHG
jgi:hypothetical protein